MLIRFGVIVYRRRIGDYRWLAEPLLYTSLFCIVVLTLGFSDGGLETYRPDRGSSRFSHLLPIDNVIPLVVADALRFGDDSDAAARRLAVERPAAAADRALSAARACATIAVAYQVVASWLQATFLLGVWGIAVAAMLPMAARRLVLLACCLLPTAIINTFYVWPKMLAVGYLLLVFALLFCRKPETDRERKAFGILIGGLTALAMLSHGSSLFALIGFAVVVLTFWAWPPLKTMIYGAVTLLALYVPWVLYQSLIEPPGNRLLKWHFAGVIDDRRSLVPAGAARFVWRAVVAGLSARQAGELADA